MKDYPIPVKFSLKGMFSSGVEGARGRKISSAIRKKTKFGPFGPA